MVPDYGQALVILEKYNKEPFHVSHGKIVAETMRRFAVELDAGAEGYWEAVGLLHDVDFEGWPDEHCVKGSAILLEEGVDEGFVRSAMSHGWGLNESSSEPGHVMEKVLYAVDELTGLVGAAALMRPSKSVSDMELPSLKKKYKDKRFAAGCSREVIERGAGMLGWTLDELLERTLGHMKAFHP